MPLDARDEPLPSRRMSWPGLSYDAWEATCDTLHAHTQVLGKLAATIAPPEPQLQHAALRITARGWETLALPAPDGSGAFVVALDLHAHEAVAEHSDGRRRRVALTPDRPVGEVTREVLAAVGELVGPVTIDPTPQKQHYERVNVLRPLGDAYIRAMAGGENTWERVDLPVLRFVQTWPYKFSWRFDRREPVEGCSVGGGGSRRGAPSAHRWQAWTTRVSTSRSTSSAPP